MVYEVIVGPYLNDLALDWVGGMAVAVLAQAGVMCPGGRRRRRGRRGDCGRFICAGPGSTRRCLT